MGLAAYLLVWISSAFLNGGYDKPIRLKKLIQGIAIGTGIILIGYSLLPEAFRFSRAIILLGAAWTLLFYILSRLFFHVMKFNSMTFAGSQSKRIVIVGQTDEAHRVKQIMDKAGIEMSYLHYVSPNGNGFEGEPYGRLSQLDEIVEIYKINEIVFCSKNIPSHDIISIMSGFPHKHIEFKIAPPESLYIIGSNNINHPGDYYVYNINNISRAENLRRKRLLDLNMSVVLLAFSPLLIFLMRRPLGFFLNIFRVLLGLRSWVGFNLTIPLDHKLPRLKKGILNPVDFVRKPIDNPETIDNLNILYARDYKVWNDIQIVLKAFRSLGR